MDYKKIKYTVNLRNERTTDEGLPYIGLENIESKTGQLFYNENDEKTVEGLSGVFFKDDVLFGKLRPYLAKSIIAPFNGKCSTEFIVMKCHYPLHNKYLHYLSLSKWFLDLVDSSTYGAKMPRASWDFIGQIKIGLPSYNNQIAIANNLEQKTKNIRLQIAKAQKMIELLKEKKEVLIVNAVTKGLDPTVSMKDSGINWIGEIPTDWEVKKIKYLCSLSGRIGWQGLTAAEYIDEGPFLITGTDFYNGSVNWNTCAHISEERYEEARQIQVHNNDLLITKDGTIGKVAIVENLNNKASLNSGVLLIRPLRSKQYQTKYLAYILKSLLFWRWYSSCELGNSTIKHLYQEQFSNFSFPVPPYDEQKKIVDHIDKVTNIVDRMIAKNEDLIKKLAEYQEALITAAVTGKIDVRGNKDGWAK